MAPMAQPGTSARFAAGPAAERTERTRAFPKGGLPSYGVRCADGGEKLKGSMVDSRPTGDAAAVPGPPEWTMNCQIRAFLTYAPLRHHAPIDGELRPPAVGRVGAR
jgi:hypothetical protein